MSKKLAVNSMIIDTCEMVMNDHTCDNIEFIIKGNINKTLYFK